MLVLAVKKVLCFNWTFHGDPDSQAKKVDDLRQKLRMRGLRCHSMYCRSSTRLQTIPLLASRAQALRYIQLGARGNVIKVDLFLFGFR